MKELKCHIYRQRKLRLSWADLARAAERVSSRNGTGTLSSVPNTVLKSLALQGPAGTALC